MKILLFATSFENPTEEAASYPLALGYLGAVLEKKGYNVKAHDFLFKPWKIARTAIKQIILREKPEIVGISSMTTNRISSFELIKMIKKINPEIKIVLGGVHPNIMYKQILENLPVDFIVLGEGEFTFLELVESIKNKSKNIEKIKGIAFKKNGELVKTPIREFVRNLDDIPFPKHEYFKDKIEKSKKIYITTSRGCPIGCTFCSTTLHWGRMRRQRSVKNVIQEIKSCLKMFPNVKRIAFNDDEFIINKDWVIDFCENLIKENIKLDWDCCGRVSSITDELVKIMRKAGCNQINFGVESGSEKMIKFMCKRITREQIISAFKICKNNNMGAGLYLMVGLPGENRKTINETISLIREIPNAQLNIPAIFQIYPGTPVYDIAKKQGFISDDYWLRDLTAPIYTYENSRLKLMIWSIKISFFHKFYRKELFSFILKSIKNQLKPGKISRIFKMYLSGKSSG